MTALNWTKDRARHMPREVSHDDLPPTGSWADRRRYGAQPSKSYGYRSGPRAPSQVITRDRYFDFSQLQAYLGHALHSDFKKKTSTQRSEVISILRKLVNRCEYWAGSSSHAEKTALDKAVAFLKAQAH